MTGQPSLFSLLPKVREARPVRPASEAFQTDPHLPTLSTGEIKSGSKDVCERYHKGNTFSVAAGQKAAKGAEGAKAMILEQLRLAKIFLKGGLCCEEIENLTGLSHQSCSARIAELKRDGKIYVEGSRLTRSGSKAAVYKVKE